MVIDLNKIKTENDRTLKDKLKDGLEVAKEKGGDMVDWVKENPREFAAIVASAAALTAGAGKVIKGINRHATAKQEQYNKERYIYDSGKLYFLLCVSFCTRFPSNKVKVPEHQTRKEV